MPPKKRKASAKSTASDGSNSETSSPVYVWLLKFESGGRYEPLTTEMALYSTMEKAMVAAPDVMDQYACVGDDWKNGIDGFGKEDEDPYLGFEYLGGEVGRSGGVIFTNQNADSRETVMVSLKRLQVDPPKREIEENPPDIDTSFIFSNISY